MPDASLSARLICFQAGPRGSPGKQMSILWAQANERADRTGGEIGLVCRGKFRYGASFPRHTRCVRLLRIHTDEVGRDVGGAGALVTSLLREGANGPLPPGRA